MARGDRLHISVAGSMMSDKVIKGREYRCSRHEGNQLRGQIFMYVDCGQPAMLCDMMMGAEAASPYRISITQDEILDSLLEIRDK